jgi:hypothetical protein
MSASPPRRARAFPAHDHEKESKHTLGKDFKARPHRERISASINRGG